MPLLTLDRVSVAYGHLPLLDEASLADRAGRARLRHRPQRHRQVDAAERRRRRRAARRRTRLDAAGPAHRPPGAGRAVPGRAAGVRRGRRRPGRPRQPRHRLSPRRRSRYPRRRRSERLERLGALQHELEQRDGWRLEQQVEVVPRSPRPAGRRQRGHAVGRMAPPRPARARAGRPARPAAARRADQPSRHRVDDLARVVPHRLRRHGGVRHPRPGVSAERRDADRRARSRPPVVVAGRLRHLPAPQGGVAGGRGGAAGEVRQEARRGGGRGCARASRRGAPATRGACAR